MYHKDKLLKRFEGMIDSAAAMDKVLDENYAEKYRRWYGMIVDETIDRELCVFLQNMAYYHQSKDREYASYLFNFVGGTTR